MSMQVHAAGGSVVGEAGQGVHAAQAHRGGVLAELGDGRGEAFGVHAGRLAQGTVLVDSLAPVSTTSATRAPAPATTPKASFTKFSGRSGP